MFTTATRPQKSALARAFLALFVATALSRIAYGQTDTWKGGTGNWSNGSMWSSGVPGSSSNVAIDGGKAVASTVTLDINDAINSLTVDSDDSLSILDNRSLTINGSTISNAGVIQLNSGNDNTNLIVAGNDTVTLSGGGKLIMGNNAANRVYSAGGSGVLVNQETIQGSGQLGVGLLSLKNSGTIDANQSTPLSFLPMGAV